MNLLIRADASVAMGTGHIMRCLALAQAWQGAGGTALFAAAEITAAMRSRLAEERCEVVDLACAAGSAQDAEQTSALARARNAAWVVVDGYQFESNYQKMIKDAGSKLLFLDDYGHSDYYYADLVLNQNLDANERQYPGREPNTRLLLGTKYCLLRREFSVWRDWEREIAPVARKVLITMGGSDPDNVTGFVVDALVSMQDSNLHCTILAPPDHPARAAREALGSHKKYVEWKAPVSDMSNLIAQADFGILAAGGTLWEFLYMGCPVLSFARNRVQQRILTELQSRGMVQPLGNPREVTIDSTALAILELAASEQKRARMAHLGRREVDGRGAERVCDRMRNWERWN
jgi:UDP-2,4-diacetamido-2,4,6-trideoxy-beta-L-altropyranose hydrolase